MRIFRVRSNAWQPFANRVTSQPPRSASSVLPLAIPSDVQADPAVVTLTRNAPAKSAGQTRYPSSSVAASAMPVGGHTVVALGCTEARVRPTFPATK